MRQDKHAPFVAFHNFCLISFVVFNGCIQYGGQKWKKVCERLKMMCEMLLQFKFNIGVYMYKGRKQKI